MNVMNARRGLSVNSEMSTTPVSIRIPKSGSRQPVWVFPMDVERVVTNWRIVQTVRPTKGREGFQAPTNTPNLDCHKNNRFYTFHSKSDQEESPYVITVMLQVFSIKVYDLLYPSSTLSFVTPLMAMNYYILPDIFN